MLKQIKISMYYNIYFFAIILFPFCNTSLHYNALKNNKIDTLFNEDYCYTFSLDNRKYIYYLKKDNELVCVDSFNRKNSIGKLLNDTYFEDFEIDKNYIYCNNSIETESKNLKIFNISDLSLKSCIYGYTIGKIFDNDLISLYKPDFISSGYNYIFDTNKNDTIFKSDKGICMNNSYFILYDLDYRKKKISTQVEIKILKKSNLKVIKSEEIHHKNYMEILFFLKIDI